MSWLGKMFGRGDRRQDQRALRLRYAAAKAGRLVGDWTPVGQDVNALISWASPIVRSRMRQLVRDFPPFTRAVNMLVKCTVGTGVQFQSQVLLPNGDPDRAARTAIEDAWRIFCEEADASGSPAFRLSLHELAALAKRQEEEQGEYLCVFQGREDPSAFIPLGLAFYESERLSGLGAAALSGNDVHDGVEFNKTTGAVLAFHVESDALTRRVVRIPAEQCLFGLRRDRVGQLRGITSFAPAVLLAGSLRSMVDAELDAAKMASKWLALVTTNHPDGMQLDKVTDTDDQGRRIEEMENAIIDYLEPGEDVKIIGASGRGGGEFQSFCKFILRLIAITRDLPYDLLSGDTSDVNYSTLRVSRNDFAQALAPDQQRIISQFYKPVFRRFLREAVLRGRIKLPGYWSDPWRYERGLWIPPGQKPIDALKEFQAAVLAIKSGLRSPQAVIMEMGGDPERTVSEIAAWHSMCAEYGLDFSQALADASSANQQQQPEEDDSQPAPGRMRRIK